MRGRRWPRSDVADCLMAIRISPTFVPVGPVCTRSSAASSAVPESNSRHARSTSQPASSARSTCRHRRWRPHRRSARRCHRCPRPAAVRARRRAAAARRPAPDAYCARRARGAPAASPSIRRPTRVRRHRRRAARRRTRAATRGGLAVEARGARFELQAVRTARPRPRRTHRGFDVGDDVALDAIARCRHRGLTTPNR